jgi:L-lactate dehydrogenase complex protein LldG
MSSRARDQILSAIRRALGPGVRESALPPLFELEPISPIPSQEQLLESFCSESRSLGAVATVVPDAAGCVSALREWLREHNIASGAVQSAPLAMAIASSLDGMSLKRADTLTLDSLERADYSLIEGRALLADTGSVMSVSSCYQDRLLPYLPRTCVVVSQLASLYASLGSEAMACIDEEIRAGRGGEAVIITGPSRTADIEKELVLGAHGPATLAVFIIAR